MNPQNIGEAAQSAATDEVAVRVVDFFQTVEVEQQNSERASVAIGALRLAFKDVEQTPIVRETGEGIADSKMLDLLEQACVIEQRAAERHAIASHGKRLCEDE